MAAVELAVLQSNCLDVHEEHALRLAEKASVDAEVAALDSQLMAEQAEVKTCKVVIDVMEKNNLDSAEASLAAQAATETAKARLAAAEIAIAGLTPQRNEACERADAAAARLQELTEALAAANAELVKKAICIERLRRGMIKAQKEQADLAAQVDANVV